MPKHGNFYYSQSGYKSPLTGAVVRVSPDGRYSEFVGTDLRNPNGMGSGGPDDWITITDNPSGRAVFNGFTIATERAHYGYQKERTVPMLVVLPARVDSSSGGQCWSDPERWGPLSGSIVHTSYSRCAVFYCFAQKLEPFPNGFAVRFPFDLDSGAMRPRLSTTDGQVYVASHKGWDTTAKIDGIIYRLRHTGEAAHLVCGAEATGEGIVVHFSCDLDPMSIKAANVLIVRESDNKNEVADKKQASAVTLLGKRSVLVRVPGIDRETVEHRTRTDEKTGSKTVTVNPPYALHFDLKASDGSPIQQTVFATINALP